MPGVGHFSLAELRRQLKPFRLYWFPRLGSTNDHAARLRRCGRLFAPAVVLTGRQIAGRGRGSNTWWSGPGVLTVTFALPVSDRAAQELPLLAGLAVRNAAVELTAQQNISLKWPNDVLCERLKLAGLLCERIDKVDLVGIGLNINCDPRKSPRELQNRITSLRAIGGKEMDMTHSLVCLASHLRLILRQRIEQPFSVFVRQYQRHDALAGETITVVPPGSEPAIHGQCEGIDFAGRLLIRQRGKLHRLVAGQVIFKN